MIPKEHLDALGEPAFEGERKSVMEIPPLDPRTILENDFECKKITTFDYTVVSGRWTFIRRYDT